MSAEPLSPEPDDPFGNLLPNDIAAEQAVLASMMRWAVCIEQVTEIVVPADFFRPQHQAIAEALVVMWAQQQVIDPITLRAYLTAENSSTNAWGGPGYLAELNSVATTLLPHAAPAHARLVRDCAIRRRLIEAGNRLVQGGYDPGMDVADVLGHAEDEVATAAKHTSLGDSALADLYTTEQFCGLTFDRARNLIPGLLDAEDRVVVVAPEGAGKTTVAHQLVMTAGSGIHPFAWTPMAPIRGLIIDLENPRGLLQRRTRRMQEVAARQPSWQPGNVMIWTMPGGLDLNNMRDAALLSDVIRRAKPDVIAAGPIYKMLQDRPGTSADVTHGGVARFWDQIRERHGCAIWLETHVPIGRGQGAKRGERDMRPLGWAGWSRWPEFGLALYPGKAGSLRVDRFRGDREEGRLWPEKLERNPQQLTGAAWPWVASYPQGTFTDPMMGEGAA